MNGRQVRLSKASQGVQGMLAVVRARQVALAGRQYLRYLRPRQATYLPVQVAPDHPAPHDAVRRGCPRAVPDPGRFPFPRRELRLRLRALDRQTGPSVLADASTRQPGQCILVHLEGGGLDDEALGGCPARDRATHLDLRTVLVAVRGGWVAEHAPLPPCDRRGHHAGIVRDPYQNALKTV